MQDLSKGITVIVLLLVTGFFLEARKQPEKLPPHLSLSDFPQQLGTWKAQLLPINSEVREILGDGDFLDLYYPQAGVDMFIAYFATQRTGSTIHSPKNCLPGAGWTPMPGEAYPIAIPISGQSVIHANRDVIAKGTNKQLVVYWYQAHGRTIASEYAAKFYLVADAMRMNRSDGAMVRLITPMFPGEDSKVAQQRLQDFAQQAAPELDRYIPR